jgi:hypothetical protein
MEQRLSVGLFSLLSCSVTTQLMKALWQFTPIPKGVLVIAIALLLGVGLSGWVKYLSSLRVKQFRSAQVLQEQAKGFGYLIEEDLVRAELDLSPSDRNDLQTRLLRFDQSVPVVAGVLGLMLGLM